LSFKAGQDVYLKLDLLQASGSFKDRGVAHLCYTLKTEQGTTQLISSSGGNAGLAVATVGKELGMSVKVVVPQTTKELVIQKLKSLGADVTVHGENWNAADLLARQMVDQDASAAYISPYDNPLLWTGHSTLIDELVDELEDPPGAVIVSVGGGGLICGVLEGLERRGMTSHVIAAETKGASSFCQAWKKGEIIRLDSIDTVATSLGALEVTHVALERSKKHQEAGGVVMGAISTDQEAVDACLQFAKDHRMLVEPACGAALAVVYSERLRKEVLAQVTGPIIVEVCGGSGVNIDLLTQWRNDLSL
jgi:L-serine/L-threonine ammonia-lyase